MMGRRWDHILSSGSWFSASATGSWYLSTIHFTDRVKDIVVLHLGMVSDVSRRRTHPRPVEDSVVPHLSPGGSTSVIRAIPWLVWGSTTHEGLRGPPRWLGVSHEQVDRPWSLSRSVNPSVRFLRHYNAGVLLPH
uniref:Uncharacterized protein n=1 Tax=Solanum tuberosum TaxID=4113 RepID=M1DEQ0_SOLTU